MNYNKYKEMISALLDNNLLLDSDKIIDYYTEENEYGIHNIIIVKDSYNIFWKFEIEEDVIYRWVLSGSCIQSFEKRY